MPVSRPRYVYVYTGWGIYVLLSVREDEVFFLFFTLASVFGSSAVSGSSEQGFGVVVLYIYSQRDERKVELMVVEGRVWTGTHKIQCIGGVGEGPMSPPSIRSRRMQAGCVPIAHIGAP